MRRMMGVLLASCLLVSALGAVAPAWAKGGKHRRGRDVIVVAPGHVVAVRPHPVVVIPRDVVVLRPRAVRVLRPVVIEDVILIPGHDFRVIDRDRDHFLIIVGTRNILVILRS